jgi:hypothetical protein
VYEVGKFFSSIASKSSFVNVYSLTRFAGHSPLKYSHSSQTVPSGNVHSPYTAVSEVTISCVQPLLIQYSLASLITSSLTTSSLTTSSLATSSEDELLLQPGSTNTQATKRPISPKVLAFIL